MFQSSWKLLNLFRNIVSKTKMNISREMRERKLNNNDNI